MMLLNEYYKLCLFIILKESLLHDNGFSMGALERLKIYQEIIDRQQYDVNGFIYDPLKQKQES